MSDEPDARPEPTYLDALAAGIRDETQEVNAGRVEPRFTCVDCGHSMRTRGTDGRCYDCLKPRTRVTCRGWLSSMRVPMFCAQPVMQEGEPGGEIVLGQCRLCAEMEHQARVVRLARQERETQRKALKGYGLAPEGVDVFAGFHEGDE